MYVLGKFRNTGKFLRLLQEKCKLLFPRKEPASKLFRNGFTSVLNRNIVSNADCAIVSRSLYFLCFSVSEVCGTIYPSILRLGHIKGSRELAGNQCWLTFEEYCITCWLLLQTIIKVVDRHRSNDVAELL